MKIVEEIKENWKRILLETGVALVCGIIGYAIGKNNNKGTIKKNYYNNNYKHEKYYKR